MASVNGQDAAGAERWTVLVVEDDVGLNRLICRRFDKDGFGTHSALSGREAVKKAGGENVLLLLDYILPDMNGRQLVEELRSKGCAPPFIVMTGRGDERIAVEMMKAGARDYVTKEVDFADRLAQAVRRVVRDVESERRLAGAEAALRESEERYRWVTENIQDVIYSVSSDGAFGFVGGDCQGILGIPAGELVGMKLEEAASSARVSPRAFQGVMELYGRTVAERKPTLAEVVEIERAGEPRFLEVKARIQYDGHGHLVGSTGVVRDITERKRAEERLLHLNRTLLAVRSVNHLITHEHDQDRLLKQACAILTETSGYDAAFVVGAGPDGGQSVFGHSGLAERAPVLEAVVAGGGLLPCVELASKADRPVVLPDTSSECMRCPLKPAYLGSGSLAARVEHGGTDFGVLVAVLPASIVQEEEEQALFRELAADIGYALHACEQERKRRRAEEELVKHREHLEELVEERTRALKKAQETLVRQEKLATLGRVAGSIAHELRNPLGAIRNASFFLQKTAADKLGGKSQRHLQIIDEYVEQAEKAITMILDFTQGRPTEPSRCAVRRLLERTVADAVLPPNISVLLDVRPPRLAVLADDRQMRVVLRNLLVNAAQAMPDGGEIRVAGEPAGDGIAIAVSDAGHGIEPEHMSRLFEPLFTTKSIGVGLGLAICKTFIEANRGTIEVQSEPGRGTTVTVTLPAAEAKAR